MNERTRVLTLVFNQRPLPKQSARFTTKTGKIVSYQTAVIKQFEKNILVEALTQKPKGFAMFTGCLRVDLQYMYKYTKGMRSLERKHIEDGGLIRKVTIPDVMDNLNKPVLDALRGRFYSDDNIISIGQVSKVWGLKDQIALRITEMSIFI